MQELSCLCVRIRLFIACDFFFSRVYLIFCISGGIWQHRKKMLRILQYRNVIERTNTNSINRRKKKQQQMWSHTFNNNSNNSNREKPHTPNDFFVFLWYFVLPSIPNCPYRHWRLFEVDLVIYFSYFCLLDVWFFLFTFTF